MAEQKGKFLILITLTPEGAKDADAAVKDVAATCATLAEALKIDQLGQYVTMGRFDMMMLIAAESPMDTMYFASELARSGVVLTETVPIAEFPEWTKYGDLRGHVTKT